MTEMAKSTNAPSLLDLFDLPRDFPHDRFKVTENLSWVSGCMTFRAHDSVNNKDVFLKFINRPVEAAGLYQDFALSLNSTDPQIVPSIQLYDSFRYHLEDTELGPGLKSDEIVKLQLQGFDRFMENIRDNYDGFSIRGFHVAIVKEFIASAMPLHVYVKQGIENNKWLVPEVEKLIENLSGRGILVRDIMRRPDGTLSGNILVVPDEQRVCISDLEYSDVTSPEECRKDYAILLGDFYEMLGGVISLDTWRLPAW